MAETTLDYRLRKLKEKRDKSMNTLILEYFDKSSALYKNEKEFSELLESIYRYFEEEQTRIIDEEVSKDHMTFVEYLTKDQVLHKYGHHITEQELDKLIEQANK